MQIWYTLPDSKNFVVSELIKSLVALMLEKKCSITRISDNPFIIVAYSVPF